MDLGRKENIIKRLYDISYTLPGGEKRERELFAATEEGARLALLSELPDAEITEIKEREIKWRRIQKRRRS